MGRWLQKTQRVLQIPLQTVLVWGLLLGIALFAPLLSHNKPLVCRTDAGWSFPFLSRHPHDHDGSCRVVLRPLVPFHPSELDMEIRNPAPPWTKSGDGRRHYLGTDEYGRDVAAGLIYGSRLSISIALLSMAIATLLGMVFGIPAGRFQHANPTIPVLSLVIWGCVILYSAWLLYWHGAWVKWSDILFITSITLLVVCAGCWSGSVHCRAFSFCWCCWAKSFLRASFQFRSSSGY